MKKEGDKNKGLARKRPGRTLKELIEASKESTQKVFSFPLMIEQCKDCLC